MWWWLLSGREVGVPKPAARGQQLTVHKSLLGALHKRGPHSAASELSTAKHFLLAGLCAGQQYWGVGGGRWGVGR